MYKIERIYINNTSKEIIVEDKNIAMKTFYEYLKDLEDIKFINIYKKKDIYELKLKYIKEKDMLKFF